MAKTLKFVVSTETGTPHSRAGVCASVEDALKQVAALRKKNRGRLPGPVEIVVEDGFYELERTLEIGPDRGGEPGRPVVIRAARGARPVLSGGRRIGGWEPGMINGMTCWMATLPEVRQGRWNFTQLFVNGVRRPRGRLPETGFRHFTGTPSGARGFNWYTVDAAHYAPGDFEQSWANAEDITVVALQHWFDMHLKVKSIHDATRTVTFQGPAIGSLYDEGGHGARFFVENVREAVRHPGQWYLDRSEGRLYYIPRPGETPETVTVVAPRLETLVALKGKGPDAPVRQVRFEGLSFQHAEWVLPAVNSGAVQAAFNVPGAVTLLLAEDCSFEHCEVAHVAQYAVENRRGSRGTRIVSCHLHDLGGGGVKVLHEWDEIRPGEQGQQGFRGMDPVEYGWLLRSRAETRKLPWGTNVLVSDCEIHDGGEIYPSAIGVWIGDAGGNRVQHNHIYNFYYTAVSCGWHWNYGRTRSLDNRIEFNHLHDIGRGLLSDMGAVYMLGPQPGLMLRNNLIHDVTCFGYGGTGIYPDQGSSYLTVEDNVVYRCQSAAFGAHFGREMAVRNNILVSSSGGGCYGIGRTECVQSVIFERNILLSHQGPVACTVFPNAVVDRNLFWAGGRQPDFAGLTLEQWRGKGFDRHGVVGDPLFVNDRGGNFSLRPDSPAFKIGFKPVDLSEVGPRRRPRFTGRETGFTGKTFTVRLVDDDHARALPKNDIRALLYHRISWMLPADEPQPFHVFAENFTGRPLKGEVRVFVDPPEAGTVTPERVAVSVSPGGTFLQAIKVRMKEGYGSARIRAVPAGALKAAPATSLLMTEQRICRALWLDKDDAEIGFEDLQVAVPAEKIANGVPVAQVRLGVTATRVWVSADVVDDRITAAPAPWAGSCLEFFTSPNAKQALQQFFLVPADGKVPPRLAYMHNCGVADCPDSLCRFERTPEGWRMLAGFPRDIALIPAGGQGETRIKDVLGVESVVRPVGLKGVFYAEATVKHHLPGSEEIQSTPLLGTGNYSSYEASGYAVVRVG